MCSSLSPSSSASPVPAAVCTRCVANLAVSMPTPPPCRLQGGQGADQGPDLAKLEGGAASLRVLTGIVFTAVVTTTTSTTVVHAPYPQPPSVPPSYSGPSYQGYHPIPPQPGMTAASYPTQCPPPYLAQPMGPPAYQETLAGEYHCQLTLPYPEAPEVPTANHFLSVFRRCSHTLFCQPASLQPSLHGPPEGRPLSTPLHRWLPLVTSCVYVCVCSMGMQAWRFSLRAGCVYVLFVPL